MNRKNIKKLKKIWNLRLKAYKLYKENKKEEAQLCWNKATELEGEGIVRISEK